MRIRKAPFPIDFAENFPRYEIRTSPYYSEGRCYEKSFIVTTLPEGFVSLRSDHFNLDFRVVAFPSDSPNYLTKNTTSLGIEDFQKIQHNYYVNEFYKVKCEAIENGQIRVTFKAHNPGQDSIIFYHHNYPGAIISGSTITGLPRSVKSNYRIVCKFLINGEISTPYMYLDDSASSVNVSTRILQPYFRVPEVPLQGETVSAIACRHNLMKVALLYGEMYDNGNGNSVKWLRLSDEVVLINGKLPDYEFKNNIPDWKSANNDRFYQSSGLDIFGQNNDDFVYTERSVEQYLYVSNFTSDSIEKTITMTVTRDGEGDTSYSMSLVFGAMGIYRIPISLHAFGVHDSGNVISASITLDNIRRELIFAPYEYGFSTFMMLNSMNLYEPFVVDSIAEEIRTDGERVRKYEDSYITTGREVVFTANVGWRDKRSLEILRSAYGKQHNIILDGDFAWYIDMIPESIVVNDDNEDVLNVSFKFRKRKYVNRVPTLISTIENETVITRTDNLILGQ